MYPPSLVADSIADAIIALFSSKKQHIMELIVDDMAFLDKKRKRIRQPERIETEDFSLESEASIDDICTDDTCTLRNDNNDRKVLNEVFPFDEVA